jgi:hypothetical protein
MENDYELIDERLHCSKHGDVTEAVIKTEYTIIDPVSLKRTVTKGFYCIKCLDDVFRQMQEEGKIGKLEIRHYVHKSDESSQEASTN